MSDKNIVSTVQDYKSAHIHENFKSSKPAEQHRLHQRIPKEKDDLVALAEGRTPNYKDLSHLLPINVASLERMQVPHKLQSESQQLHETAHSAKIIPAFAAPEKLHKATLKDVAPVTHEQTVHEHKAAHRAASPLLKEGSHGNEVMNAQKKLNALHYKGPNGTDLAADKIFGRATEFAVRNFQKENGLTADGLIGPKTHEALNSPTAKAAPDMSRSEFAEKKAAQVPEPSKTPFNVEAYWQSFVRKGQEHDAYTARQDQTAVTANRTGQTPELSETVSDVKAYWQNIIRKGQACLDAEAQQGRINAQDQSRGNSMHM